MTELKTLHDLFVHELHDLYSAENQIIAALPKMAEKATNPQLKEALERHLDQSKEHASRLEEVMKDLNIEIEDVVCKGMLGLIEEGKEIMEMKAEPETLDAGIIIAAQRVEHYEISGYGSVIAHAKEMEYENAVTMLLATLQEEEETDEELSDIAKEVINKDADLE